MKSIRIAAFGFRSIPPQNGSAGADKFAVELYSRLVKKGIEVVAYNRIYDGNQKVNNLFDGIRIINLKTIKKSGFDTFFHSLKATLHIIIFNTGNVVHIHNGGNSIFGLILRLFGKKVFISQDGIDWKRDKWKWYAKIYLYSSMFITAYIPNKVIFDNIFAKEVFEKKFKKKYNFIPYGCEVEINREDESILYNLNLKKGEYFLFVGRFIPDKGLHYLIPAFEKVITEKKLVLVGGSPNPSQYETEIKKTVDKRIIFSGYIYGDGVVTLMKNAYTYIQPSDVEGLSPVILTVLGLGVPLICSDIKENLFIVKDEATIFKKSDVDDLVEKLNYVLKNSEKIKNLAIKAQKRVIKDFSWEKVTDEHLKLFSS